MVALLDTLSIFERFRTSLGEAKARVFAQTLGTMIEEAKNAATKDDIRLPTSASLSCPFATDQPPGG